MSNEKTKKTKSKRILSAFIIFAAICASLAAFASCEDEIETFLNEDLMGEEYGKDDTWAIYWYLCGSDLETCAGCATEDLFEMMEVTLPDNVFVVIEAGGSEEWQNEFVDEKYINRFLYAGDELYLIETLPPSDMGEKKTFEDFLRFCGEKYPADHQAVILWNHGGGSVAGVIFDELYDDSSLSLVDIRQAFDSVFKLSRQNPPIELIGFDACLMATIETAYALRDIAKYMVASEETEPGCGWNYTGFLQALADNPGLNGAMLGKEICDSYAQGCNEIYQGGEITLSVVDLTRISPLIAAYNNAGAESLASACQNSGILAYLGRSADSAEKYGSNDKNAGYTNMVDLGDLTRNAAQYLPDTAKAIADTLNDCVVYKVNGPYRSQSSGLSCYYPYDMDEDTFIDYTSISASAAHKYLYEYLITGNLTDEGWRFAQSMQYEAIPAFSPNIASNSPAVSSSAKPEAVPTIQNSNFDLEDYPVEVDDDGNAVLYLGREIADILAGVYFELAYFSEEDDIILFLGKDNDIDCDWENGVFRDNFRGVWGAIDDNVVYMEITYEGNDYNLYSIPILLNGEECSLRVCYDYNAEEWEILGARRGLEENGMSDRNLIMPKPGDIITTLLYASSLSKDDEIVQVEIDVFAVTEDMAFGETDLGDGMFILLFEMVDARNNSMYSEAVPITVEDDVIYVG
ncbi:MAG: clostripain-related cysteine peptidase [Oscillospiraceae bacterium]|nr:clostripain-related cysteine peptidase [Oscillospiraceae bacterium]